MAKPNKLLKVVSILFIIFGIIGVIAGAVVVATLGVLTAAITADAKTAVTIMAVSGVVMLLGAIFELVAGALGVKAKKLGACRVVAIIILVFGVIGLILRLIVGAAVAALSGGGMGSTTVISVFSIILPILYFIGVKMQIKAQ